MSIEGKMFADTVVASADLSAAQYKVITVAGAIAANNTTAIGVLLNKPTSGEHASVGILGKMKGVAGAAVSAGARVMVTTSGFLITTTSGSGSVGKLGIAAANSGDTVSFWGNFINAGTTI